MLSFSIADDSDRVYTSCSILISTQATPVYPTCTVNIDMDPPSTPCHSSSTRSARASARTAFHMQFVRVHLWSARPRQRGPPRLAQKGLRSSNRVCATLERNHIQITLREQVRTSASRVSRHVARPTVLALPVQAVPTRDVAVVSSKTGWTDRF